MAWAWIWWMWPGLRRSLRRIAPEAAPETLGRGMERVAEQERLLGVLEAERPGAPQALDVIAAELDEARDRVEALAHSIDQHVRRGAGVEGLGDAGRQLRHRQRFAGASHRPAKAVMEARRAVLQLGRQPRGVEGTALAQVAIQQRRRGRMGGGVQRGPGSYVKQPA